MNEADNISQGKFDSDVESDAAGGVDGRNSDSAICVEFSVRLDELPVDKRNIDLPLLRNAVVIICRDAGFVDCEISVAIVGNREMQELHRQFLGVDETTDVMSFPLERNEQRMVADIVVCQEVAEENSRELGCIPIQELLLYIVHGTLHLVGYDDTSDAEFQQMRAAEVEYMHRFGFTMTARDQSAHPEGDAS